MDDFDKEVAKIHRKRFVWSMVKQIVVAAAFATLFFALRKG